MPITRSTSATSSVRGWPSRSRSDASSAATAQIRTYPASEYRCAGPGSASASARPACSDCSPGRALPSASSRAAASVTAPVAPWSERIPSSPARFHRARMSAAPICQRAPVRTRTAALPAIGSATRRSIATTSATSGVCSRPPRPTTSTARPRARSSSAIGAASALRRTSTAAVGGFAPSTRAASYCSAIRSATQARSVSTVSRRASRTSPGTAAGRARSLLTSTPLSRNGSEIMLASSRASGGFRQLVSNSSLGAGVPSASGKSVAKRGRLAADAPRQP